MQWKDVLEILGVFLLCAVKFSFMGVPAAVAAKWHFFKVLTVTISGGMAGTVFFVYLSEEIMILYRFLEKKFRHPGRPVKIKPRFTRRNKMIVRIKNKFGLWGIAFLSPSLFSIPLGAFIAVRFFKNPYKIISSFFVSIVFWAVTLYFLFNFVLHHLHKTL